jgi:hypothetical protein
MKEGSLDGERNASLAVACRLNVCVCAIALLALYISLGVIGGVILCGGIFFYVCARHGKKHRRFC